MALGLSGLIMLARVGTPVRIATAAFAVLAIVATGLFAKLDPLRMISAVYRTGQAALPASTRVNFLRDGKTATISVVERDGARFIATNGKPDAAIQMDSGPAHPDEVTMIVAAAIPLSLHCHPRRVANIGFGSGLTSSTLLASGRVERLDSIEIEPFMVQAARQAYYPRTRRVFEDARSHIYIEDAKTFFATARTPYDLIVSEPSNPWVSGVATLFSDEFYGRIVRYLRPDGLFAQWVQVYEMDMTIIASITKALTRHFGAYALYMTDDSDVLIVATPAAKLPACNASVFDSPALREELARVGIVSQGDLQERRLGDGETLGPVLASYAAPANSDYFPFVDLNAARLRFMQANAVELPSLRTLPVPLIDILSRDAQSESASAPSGQGLLERDSAVGTARAVLDAIVKGQLDTLPPAAARDALLMQGTADSCQSAATRGVWRRAVRGIANLTTPYLSAADTKPLWEKIRASACYREFDGTHRTWAAFLAAVAARDVDAIASTGPVLGTQAGAQMTPEELTYVVLATASAEIARGSPARALDILQKTWQQLDHSDQYGLPLFTVLALARHRLHDISPAAGNFAPTRGRQN
jgi:spermidine synthase